jgi:hypothetical protein
MKKIIVFIFIFLLVFTLSSCGDKTTPVANQNPVSPAETHSPTPDDNNPPPTETDTQNTVPDNQTVIPDEGTPTTASDPIGDGEPPPETDSSTPDVGNSTSTGTGTQNTISGNENSTSAGTGTQNTVPGNQTIIPGQGTSTTANTVPNTEIGRILDVNYTISSTEYKSLICCCLGDAIIRWQFVNLNAPLDMRRFPTTGQQPMNAVPRIFTTQLGDALIVTYPDGRQFLYIDVAESIEYSNARLYHVVGINIELNPTESIDMGSPNQVRFEQRRAENESQFGMIRRYESDNFYWYSNEANAQWLPYMAVEIETRFPYIVKMFGFTLEQKISVWYYAEDDYWYGYNSGNLSNPFDCFVAGHGGHAAWGKTGFTISIMRDEDRGAGTNDFNDWFIYGLLVHESVHVFQDQMYSPDRYEYYRANRVEFGGDVWSWVGEGTATWFEPEWDRLYCRTRVIESIRDNHMPTLNQLEEDNSLYSAHNWGRVAIEFIVDTWGWDYVLEKNRRPGDYMGVFGITRAEFERQWHQWLRNNFN